MDYIKVKITISEGDADLLCARLSDIADGFEIDDPAVIDDFVNDRESCWDYIEEGLYDNPQRQPSVSFYLEKGEEGQMALERARTLLDGLEGSYILESQTVQSSDWENNWKQYYKPFKVGSRLYVRPSWETIDNDEGRTVLVMDPGSSFGTGSHATTGLCMEQIDAMDCGGKRVLDMGCGSGILGCCAMLMGAESLFLCDIEENAVKTAAENLVSNGISLEKCTALCGDAIKDKEIRRMVAQSGPYDIILANIVADVLKAMSEFFREWLGKNGKLILSGIIDERADEVAGHFESCGFKVMGRAERDGWVMLCVTDKE